MADEKKKGRRRFPDANIANADWPKKTKDDAKPKGTTVVTLDENGKIVDEKPAPKAAPRD